MSHRIRSDIEAASKEPNHEAMIVISRAKAGSRTERNRRSVVMARLSLNARNFKVLKPMRNYRGPAALEVRR